MFHLRSRAEHLKDGRRHPQRSVQACFLWAFLMFASVEPSLNAVEELLRDPVRRRRWKRLFGGLPPSADTVGYALSRIELDSLRGVIHHLYTTLQRNHHIARLRVGGLQTLICDGHELFSSYVRSCPQCLQRTVHFKKGDRIQYHHKVVVAMLRSGKIALPLDAEPILPGEDEIAASIRLLERLHSQYPKLYDVFAGDSLYADPRVFTRVRSGGNHLLAVLKENHPNLLDDAKALCAVEQPVTFATGQTRYEQWDIEGFSSWWQVNEKVRVVRSRETGNRDGAVAVSDWFWVTTMSGKEASAEAVCKMGHSRWDIENDCFNYMGSFLHMNHCFHHDPNAIMAFLLIGFIAYILLQAFCRFNLKAQRRRASMRSIIGEIAFTFWADLSERSKPP